MSGFKEFTFWVSPPEPRSPFDRLRAYGILADATEVSRIKHRVFPHVTRACEGVVFKSVPLVEQLIERTHTSTGLKVTVAILDRVYESGRKAVKDLKSSLRVVTDSFLPAWNYTVLPNMSGLKGKVISSAFLNVSGSTADFLNGLLQLSLSQEG